MSTKLPNLPSALLRLALSDLRKCEAQKEVYKIDMGYWHRPMSADGQKLYDDEMVAATKCAVCLGGAVLAQTFQIPVNDDDATNPVWYENRHTLTALDDLRAGNVEYAFARLNLGFMQGQQFNRGIPEYEYSPENFHRALETLASDLSAAGF